jgi:Phosphotransferase enzyme family
VQLQNGRSVFVKHALTPEAEEWLSTERLVYEQVRGSFMPEYLGADDSLLVLEDLSTADWPPPWSSQRIDSVVRMLSDVRSSGGRPSLPRLADMLSEIVGWPTVADDPEPMLSTGICSAHWLEAALPALLRAADEAELDGDDLLHADVRSDNLCFKDDGPVLVDWNIACIGNGGFDVAFWLPSLRLEGGPQPWEVFPDAGGWPWLSPVSSRRASGDRRRPARRRFESSNRVSSRWRCRGPRGSSARLRPDGEPSESAAFSSFLESGRPLNERRRKAYASRTESQRAATEQAGPQAVAELGPPVIVPFHAS